MEPTAYPLCPACAHTPLDTRVQRSRGLCDACAVRTGLWLEPPTIRPTRPCQRCGHTQFVASQLRDRGRIPIPLSLSLADAERTGFVTTAQALPWAPMGILIAFACRACGLTELYTLEADRIPIGAEHGTYLVDYAPVDGPHR